jgi:V8-like Glu-specific endopeptidase
MNCYIIVIILFCINNLIAQSIFEKDIEKTIVLLCHTEPEIKNALGTGFIVGPKGVIVTADHVIFDEKTGNVFEKIYAIRYTGTKHRYFRVEIINRFKDAQVGRDLALLKSSYAKEVGPPYLYIGDSTSIGNDIFIAGYPKVFDKLGKYPFLRKGTIASTRYTFQGHTVLILDLRSVAGFSGSPVIDIFSGKVVAVVRGAPKGNKNTDFTVATIIQQNDLNLAKEFNLHKEQKFKSDNDSINK